MGAEFRKRVDSAFEKALEREGKERDEFVRSACQGDPELLLEVSSLVRAHEECGSFLETPSALVQGVRTALEWDEPLLADGTTLGGRFEIVRFVDRGGMGEVYEAIDRELKERVALKTIRPELLLYPKSVELLHHEVRVARRVTHRNVCRVHDIFRVSSDRVADLVFLTMAYLDGESLASRLSREKRLDWTVALPILLQILQALDEAHRQGVVHRDLKPENIILTEEAGGVRVIVTDFGLAVLADTAQDCLNAPPSSESRASSRAAWGTPAYMSPEQLRGEAMDHRSDLFSFGVIAYEVLTGLNPYPVKGGEPLGERFRVPIRPIQGVEPRIPRTLDRVVLACLSVATSSRPRAASNALRRLEEVSVKTPQRRAVLAAVFSAAGVGALALTVVPDVIDGVARFTFGPRVLPLENTTAPAALKLLREGLERLVNGSNLEAVLLLDRVVRQDPRSAFSRSFLVHALLNSGEQKVANAHSRLLHESANDARHPSSADLVRAALARIDGASSKSAEILCSLSAQYPDDTNLLLLCARVLEDGGEIPRAKGYYERAAQKASIGAALGIGRCLALSGELAEAIERISNSLASGALGTDPEVLGMAYSILGFALRDQGSNDAALAAFETALSYRRRAGDRRGQVASMAHLSMVYRYSGQLEKSIDVLEEAVGITQAMGDEMYESQAIFTLARAYDVVGRDEEALALARRSLKIELRRQDHTEIPGRLIYLATAHRRRGRYGEAQILLDRCVHHTSRSGDKLMEADALFVRARAAKEQGRFEDALDYLSRILPLVDSFGQPSIAEVKASIAGVHDQRGEYAEAERTGREALALLRGQDVSKQSVLVHCWLAHHLTDLGDFSNARTQLIRAKNTALTLHLREAGVDLDLLSGTLSRHEGDLKGAAELARSCLERTNQAGFAYLTIQSRLELASVLVRMNELDEAVQLIDQVSAEAERFGMVTLQAISQIEMAEVCLLKRQCQTAVQQARAALEMAQSFVGRPLARAALGVLGEAHARLGKMKAAQVCLNSLEDIHLLISSQVPARYSTTFERHPATVRAKERLASLRET